MKEKLLFLHSLMIYRFVIKKDICLIAYSIS